MVRETRYLWVGSLPESIAEDQICDHFSSYGKIQSVKLVPQQEPDDRPSAIVAFMDIKSASKAHNSENIISGVTVVTHYNESSAAVNTSARIQDCVNQKSVPPGACGQSQVSGGVSQQSLHSGRSQQRADGLSEDFAEARISDSVELRDAGRTSERSQGRGSGGESEKDRSRSSRPYHGSNNSYLPSHKSRLESHTVQGSKGNETRRRNGKGFDGGGGHRSSRTRSTSRSTGGRSQSQDSSGSGSQSLGQSGEKKLSSVVQLPGQASGSSMKSDDQQSDKPRGLLITGIPVRSSDSNVREGLFHDYKKYSRLMSITIEGQGESRCAVVSFKKHEDAAKALDDSKEKVFFGAKIIVTPHQGYEIDGSELHSTEVESNEFSHKATKTLYIGNLEKSTTKDHLRDIFSKFGYIIEVDIKSQGQVLSFGFVQFDNIRSVVTALRDMEDKYISGSKVKLGFGKPIPSDCVWVEGISDTVSEKYLATQFNKFGRVLTTYIDRRTGRALVYYDTQEQAVIAVNEMRGKYVAERKIQIDFASPDCRNIFLESLESSGQLRPGDRPDDRAARGCHPFAGQEFLKQRPGYEGFQPRGGRYNGCEGHIRGSYNGSRDAYFPSVVNRVGTRSGCYETFPHDRRDGLNFRGTVPKYFESHSDADPVFYDSYEVALKEYGHSRRDRESSPSLERHRSYRAGVGDSPRSSRYGSPGRERLDDTFAYRYGDGKTASTDLGFEARKEGHAGAKQGHRGFSPANSDFSQKSKRHAHRDSRSVSPASAKQRGRKDRSSSPANKDGPWNSSTDEIGYHVTSRRASKESPDCYIYSEKPGKGSTYGKCYGHSGSRNSKSRSSRCDEDSDVLSDRDRSARGLDPAPRTKALRSVDEQGARQRAAAIPTDAERQKKLELEISCNLNLIGYPVGDFSRDYGEEHQYCDGRQLSSSKADLPGAVHRHSASQANQALTSGSTTPGSRTPLNNSDQDSAGGRNSHGSDEVMVLEKRKEQLLSLLKQIEEGDSDNNVQDDAKKETKCIVVDDSDVEIDKSAEFRNNDEFYCNIDIPTERKTSGNAFDSEQIPNEILPAHKTGKTKPIDATKSFRKQMEEQRKSDLESLSSSSSPASQTRPVRPTSMSCQDPMDTEDPYGVCNSPTEIPKDFIPAKCHNVSGEASSKSPAKPKRSYRPKLSDGLFNSSSEEETGEFSPSSSQHSRHWTVPDDVCDDAGVVEKSTRIVSLESLWSGDEMPKCHLPVFRRHPRRCSGDLQSEYLPCIIPDAPVITKSSDGLGPQEPRKGISLCTREVLDLPLPRFAAEVLAAKSSATAVKATTTPAVNKPLEISHKDAGIKEPPVSPNLASSPAFDRSKVSNTENDKISDNNAENTDHKLEVDSSELGSCEPSGSTVNEKKDDVVGGICPPSTHDLSEKCVSDASTSLTVDTVTECVDSADGVAGADDSSKISSDVANVVQEEVKLEEVSANAEKEAELSETVKADATVEAESKDETEQNAAKSESIKPDQKPDESPPKDVSSVKDSACEDNRAASKQNASDSDISDLLSPTPSIPSLEERIRALDEKLNQMQQNSKPCVGEASSTSVAPPVVSFDYREKYVRRRKEAPGRLPSQTENRNEVSAVARTLLSRTSIFDQDSQRLEQLQAKYDPNATSSGFTRQPDTEPYSSLYTPLYRGAVGMGGKDGVLTQQSSAPDGFVCSSPGIINSAIHSTVPSAAWNHSSCSGQQISMPTTWPSPMATTPSPLSVVISPNLTFGQLPTPSWMSPALPNQSGYGAVRGPTVESLPAGARMPLFFHPTGFEGSNRAPGNTPPYSGGPNPSYQSHISGGDPRRLSRPDMCAVSPLMSSGILKRQSSHSSDVDLWSNIKPDPALPAKTKEIISPVSILKRPIKEETPKDASLTGDASLNPTAVDATSVAVSGIKRKPDSAFGAEANFCEGKLSGQSKNLKFNQPTTKYETVTIKSEKGTEDKTLDVKSHSSSSVIGQHGRICGEIKRTPCSMGSPKPCPAKVEEKRSAELSGTKKWEDANKIQARKTPKPSVGSTQSEKLDYAKKDCRARIMSESSETAIVEPVAGNQGKDKLGKLVKTKVVGKDSLEKLDRDREKDKDKDKDQHKEKDKEKSVQDQGSDNRSKDKMHGKPKTPEVKAPFKAKEGRDDESKKECPTPLEQSKDDGKKDKTVGAPKSGCGKERTMPLEFGKDDSKKLKAANRDSSKDSVKRNQSSGADVLSSAKSITDSESKGHKAGKAKTEKAISKQPKVGGDSSEISVKNGKPSSSVKPGTNERRDSKDSNRSTRPSGQKTSNSGSTNSVLKQPSSEHKSGSHGNKEREKDGNKAVVMKKRPSESGKTERRSDQSKKKDKKVEKPKEKRPEEKREVKALMQKFLNSDSLSTGYVSMYDMVKRRSSKEGGKDCFQSLDNRSKSLSQLQAKKSQRNRSKQSIGSSILDSDEDESFRDDSLNLKSERSRKKPSTESRSKNWINSTSSSLSSDDEEIGKSSRSLALKSGKGLNDNSSSDVSIDEFSLSAKNKTNNTKPSKPRQSIYTSSSESDSDVDSKFDKQVTSTPYLVKSKPVGDTGKSQKKGSELMGRKGKLFSRSKPIPRSLQTFSPSDVDDDDDVDDTDDDADDDSSIAAKLQNESQNRNEAVANVLDSAAAVASKRRSLLSEVSVLKKNETEMDSSENINKSKKVLKPAAITVKENTSPSKTLPSTKNEIKSKTKTEVNKKDVSIHPAETNDESAKKERHQEMIVGPKEKDKSHSQSRSDVAQKRNISDSKASKSFDKVMASDSFDKSVKRQKLKSDQEISSRNDAPSKSESSLRNELERGSKMIRDSCEKLIKRPKLDMKSVGKSFEDEESIVIVAKSVAGKTTEKLETGGEDLNANLRSDNIFEKMEMKEEPGRIVICSETVSVSKPSEAVSLGLEKQYSTISDTTTATLDEEDGGSVTIQVPEPVESSRPVVKEVDAAKLTVEKMKQDATKEEAIAEAVKAIMDLGREELGREEQRKTSEHVHHEENVVVMDVIDHNDTSVSAGEVNCPEVSSDDSDELTQAIQSLIGKELEPDVVEPVEEEEVQLEDVVSQPELDENKPEDVENNAEEVYAEVVPECQAGDEFAEDKIEIKHVEEESEKIIPESGESLKETVKVEIMESSVTDTTESKQSEAIEASSVFVEPKPLVEKEELVGVGEKDDDDPDSLEATELQSKRTKVDANKSMGDSAYFAGYFSPFPCIPIPKDEVEEQNSLVKMESPTKLETAASKSPASAAAGDCGANVLPETAAKENDSTEVDVPNETCVEALKKEEEPCEDKNKDLYEFKDEEEKMITDFVPARPRKRSGEGEANGAAETQVRAKKPKLESADEAGGSAVTSESPSREDFKMIPPASSSAPVGTSAAACSEAAQCMLGLSLATSVPKPVTDPTPVPALSLPVVTTTTAPPPPLSWQTNMDKIIDEVAKGNFDRGCDFNYYNAKKPPRSKSREEPVPPTTPSGNLPVHPDLAKQHMIMAAPGFLQMQGAGGAGMPRSDTSSLHHLPFYNAGAAAARQLVSQPQIVMLSSDKTSPRLTSPLVQNQAPFRPPSTLYQALVSSAANVQQSGLLFCAPPVGYQLAPTGLAVSHSDSSVIPMHRFLGPRDDLPHGLHGSQVHQMTSSMSTRGVEKLVNLPNQLRPGHEAQQQQQGMGMPRHGVNLHGQQELSHPGTRVMPTMMSHGVLLAHNPSSVSQNQTTPHNDQHHLSIQQQAHLQQAHQQQHQQQQKHPETMPVATSATQGHSRQEYLYRQVTPSSQVKFDGVPTALGIVSLEPGMFRQMSPKISDSLLQSLPRQPGALVAHFGNYPQSVQYGMMLPHASLSNTKDPSSSVPSSSSAQSELREALAQPSRLVQQEQLIQQQQQQQNVLQVRPHNLPDLCPSPVTLGQHRMPFAIQEPRSTSTSRAEPKSAGVADSPAPLLPGGPPMSLIQPFCDPSSVVGSHASAPDKNALGMVEAKPSPQQAYKTNPRFQMLQYDQGLARGIALDARQLEQLMLSKEVMSPQIVAAQHHLMVAGQMAPPQQQQQQQQPSMSLFSHPDLAVGRPPSVHHLPASSLSAQQGHVARPSPDHSESIAQLLTRFPVMWNGVLELKNDRAPVQMHFISGNRTLVPASLQDSGKPLHIGQRMRLEAAQLEQVLRRMMNESEYSMLVAVPCGSDPVTMMTAAHSLQNGFIRYLQEKQAAGIVNIYQPSTNQATYVIHIFPPCEFSMTNLSRFTQDIVQHTTDANFLLIIITTC